MKDSLFDEPDFYEEHWQDMPEFSRSNAEPFQKIIVNFLTKEDVDAFSKLIGQKISYKCDTLYYPLKVRIPTGIYKDESEISDIHNQ